MNNKIIYILLPLALTFDILTDTIFEKAGTLSIVKAGFYYPLILYSLIHGLKRRDSVNKVFMLFFLYVVFQIPFASHPYESLRMSLKVIMSLMMFPLGYYFINNYKKLKVLNKSVLIMMIVYILNYIVSQYYGIGTSVYTKEKEFIVGNLSDNWNIITYMLLVVPAVLLTEKRRSIVFLLSSILIILLIISLKRVAVLGLILGYCIYAIKTLEIIKSVRILIVFTVIFLAAYPIFETVLNKRIQSRGDKLSGSAVSIVERETRYLETIAVFSDVVSFEDPIKVMFGSEAFYSVGNYGDPNFFRDRQLHVDYNLILNTIGLVGLALYFNIFYFIIKKRNRIKNHIKRNKEFFQLDAVFYMLLITQFFTSFGGQIYVFSFRAIIFLYLGSILGTMYNVASKNYKIGIN